MKRAHTKLIAAAGLAFALFAGAAQANEIIMDADTGQPIKLSGLSDNSMSKLRRGGSVRVSTKDGQIVLKGEVYIPGTWIDPDGCEHWVMDDGVEGYMAPKLTRHGRPICNAKHPEPARLMVRKYDVPYKNKISK